MRVQYNNIAHKILFVDEILAFVVKLSILGVNSITSVLRDLLFEGVSTSSTCSKFATQQINLLHMAIEQGATFSYEFSFTQDEVIKFAEVTGDKNPVHLDAAYAATTMFKKPIIHGFLGGSVFSKIFGTLFPGEGTIYLKQSMSFMRPMFVDTTYEVRMTVKDVNKEKHRANVETIVVDKITGDSVITGEATVMNVTQI